MKKWLFISLGCVIVLAAAGACIFLLARKPSIPTNIAKEAGFVIFYPSGDQDISMNHSTVKYDKAISQVSFVALFHGTKLTFGEQATPETFFASPQYYSNLITKMGGYFTFQNTNGTINLTRANSIGHQAGVMNAKGTLLFVESSNHLSNSDWREIFNGLSYVQSK